MADERAIPGTREVRAALDGGDADTLVVACPPHPQYGGSRSDGRLRAVADALTDRRIDCLRIDYGPWDGGVAERDDVRNALDWAADRADRVGLFGYSFGAGVALCVAADRADLCAASVLAPPATSGDGDAATAAAAVTVPLQVVVGERDSTVDWEPVRDRAAAAGATIEAIRGDHFFAGQTGRVGETVADFFTGQCDE